MSVDETIAQSHEMMTTCLRFIKQNSISPDLAEELMDFYGMDVLHKGTISLNDQNLVYRNLPLSLQVQVSIHHHFFHVTMTGQHCRRLCGLPMPLWYHCGHPGIAAIVTVIDRLL